MIKQEPGRPGRFRLLACALSVLSLVNAAEKDGTAAAEAAASNASKTSASETSSGTATEIQQLRQKDTTIGLYGLTLRVIRSPKDGKSEEPWYILTNDTKRSRTKVVRIYYHRFEIEETFKDMKHIFELKRTRLNKPLSLKLLLWFVSLGIALLYEVTKPTKLKLSTAVSANPKKRVSWLRQAYEQLQQGYALLAWGEG